MRFRDSLFLTLFFVFTGIFLSGIAFTATLENGSFEDVTEVPWYSWGGAGTVSYGVDNFSYQGDHSVKIEADGNDYVTLGFLQDLECEEEDEITASAWLMSPKNAPLTNSNAFIRLEFWTEESCEPIKTKESEHLNGVFDWTKLEVSGVVPRGTTKVKIGLFIWNIWEDHSGEVYFDDANITRNPGKINPFVVIPEERINCLIVFNKESAG